MSRSGKYCGPVLASLFLAMPTLAQPATQVPTAETQPAPGPQSGQAAQTGPALDPQIELEPKALDILKAASDRLSAARTLAFTAVATYESPARTGAPLAYMTRFDVTLQRPDKLRVISPADGPPSEFYYDGRNMTAYAPDTRLLAVAEAPPTIEAMLKAAYDTAAIYFPFTDLIVSDPYKDMTDGLKIAFVVGQSRVVGDTLTDIIVLANQSVQIELWIGAADKLPRMAQAIFFDEPGTYRHTVSFSDWRLDASVPGDAFAARVPADAPRMPFSRPDAGPGTTPGAGGKP
jgi:hypothetical protein